MSKLVLIFVAVTALGMLAIELFALIEKHPIMLVLLALCAFIYALLGEKNP